MCRDKTFTVRVSDHGPGTFVARGDYDGSGDGARGVQIELGHEFAELGAAGALFVSPREAARIAGAVARAAACTDPSTSPQSWAASQLEILRGELGELPELSARVLHGRASGYADTLPELAGVTRALAEAREAADRRRADAEEQLATDYRAELERLAHALDAARKDLRQPDDQHAHARALQLAGEQLTARATDADVAGGAEARRAAGGLLLSVAEELAELADARATIAATAGNVRELTEQRGALRARVQALNAELEAVRDAERVANDGNGTLTEIVAAVERELGEPLGTLVDDDFANAVRDLRQRAERAEQSLGRRVALADAEG